MNKEHQNAKEKTTKRKLSTLSTTISQTDICSETNSFLPPSNLKCQNDRKTSYTQSSHIYFGRERLNSTPVTSYFEGLDFYLRGLQPEKNDYQKTERFAYREMDGTIYRSNGYEDGLLRERCHVATGDTA